MRRSCCMEANDKKILICNCEGTMAMDPDGVARAFGSEAVPISQLCRAQLEVFEDVVKRHDDVIVACTQEAPIFLEATEGLGDDAPALRFCNIREKAGWCREAPGGASTNLTAKMAALLNEATLNIPETRSVTMVSNGTVLVLGTGQSAMDASGKLAERMDVTVVLGGTGEVIAPRVMDVPVFRGQVTGATGYLGAFEVNISDSAPASPSHRNGLDFYGGGQPGVIECDLILDLRGARPLFNAPEKRDGYFNPEPGNPAAVAETLLTMTDMVGEFEKPRYVDYDPDICAHARNEITGCTKCLDACPTGAITPDGDKVAYDPYICAGCGNCASICPTGAAKYAMPAGDALHERLRQVLTTYRLSGGNNPVVLIHDTAWGEDMISAIARAGGGLPANVLPFAVNEVTLTGVETLLVASAYGAEHTCILAGPSRVDELAEVRVGISLANHILEGIGYGSGRLQLIDAVDPDVVETTLYDLDVRPGMPAAGFLAMGRKRSVMNQALQALHVAAPNAVDVLALPDGAPFGAVQVNVEGCTLCLACVGACPTGAMKDNPDMPQLSFNEQSCVQCGLCRNTCPEKVISLTPQISFLETARSHQVVKAEEPFECVRCGKAFGAKSTIEHMVSKLEGHTMFADDKALNRLKMCEDCRIIAMMEEDPQPFQHGAVPVPRTTDDYLQEREELRAQAVADMKSKGLDVNDDS